MGKIIVAKCRKCDYKSDDLYLGFGIHGAKTHYIIFNKSSNEIESISLPSRILPNQRGFVAYETYWEEDLDAAKKGVLKYFLDEYEFRKGLAIRTYTSVNGLSKLVFYKWYHPGSLFLIKKLYYHFHKCPKCQKFSIYFNEIVLFY